MLKGCFVWVAKWESRKRVGRLANTENSVGLSDKGEIIQLREAGGFGFPNRPDGEVGRERGI